MIVEIKTMNFKKILATSIIGAILWTIALTPYVILITNMTMKQYLSWLGMQFILVPIIAPIVFLITEKILRKFKLDS